MQLLERVAQHQSDHNQQGTVRNGFAKLFVHVKDCFGLGWIIGTLARKKAYEFWPHWPKESTR